MKAREESEYTVWSHFSWETRIWWTLYLYSQWFACDYGETWNFTVSNFARSKCKPENCLKMHSCPFFHGKHESAGPTPYNPQKFVALREKLMKKCHFIVSSFARPKRKPKNYSKIHSSPIFHGECESAGPTPYNPQKFVALREKQSDPHRFRSSSFWVRVLHFAAAL